MPLENNINRKKYNSLVRKENTWSVTQIIKEKISNNSFRYFLYSTNILLQLQNAAILLMLEIQ